MSETTESPFVGIPTDLVGKISTFLSEKHESSGGWAKVTFEDFVKLGDIIQDLIEMKCDRDVDGDLPIEFKLTDRTKFERTNFCSIPYENEKGDNLEEIVEQHLFNLDQSMESLRIIRKLQQMRKNNEKG